MREIIEKIIPKILKSNVVKVIICAPSTFSSVNGTNPIIIKKTNAKLISGNRIATFKDFDSLFRDISNKMTPIKKNRIGGIIKMMTPVPDIFE